MKPPSSSREEIAEVFDLHLPCALLSHLPAAAGPGGRGKRAPCGLRAKPGRAAGHPLPFRAGVKSITRFDFDFCYCLCFWKTCLRLQTTC